MYMYNTSTYNYCEIHVHVHVNNTHTCTCTQHSQSCCTSSSISTELPFANRPTGIPFIPGEVRILCPAAPQCTTVYVPGPPDNTNTCNNETHVLIT